MSRYHRVIASGTGQGGSHTITANLNNISAGVNSRGQLMATRTGVVPQVQVSEISYIGTRVFTNNSGYIKIYMNSAMEHPIIIMLLNL